MPSDQELQAIDNFLLPPVPFKNPKVSRDVVLTDYFNNAIHDNDGVYQVIHFVPIYNKGNLIKGKMLVTNILTHDTLTDFLEEETEQYESIKYLGLGKEYMKEVYEE